MVYLATGEKFPDALAAGGAAGSQDAPVVLVKGGRIVADGAISEIMTYRVLKETFDADLYCGENDLTGARFFLPMRSRG